MKEAIIFGVHWEMVLVDINNRISLNSKKSIKKLISDWYSITNKTDYLILI